MSLNITINVEHVHTTSYNTTCETLTRMQTGLPRETKQKINEKHNWTEQIYGAYQKSTVGNICEKDRL